MQRRLFISLSTVALLGISTVSYGAWTKYGPDYSLGKPIPNGDCLEMMCEHGCVEDDEFIGYCCPSDGGEGSLCQVDSKDIDACCQSGKCEDGICKPSTCSFNGKTYNNGDSVPYANSCGICNNGEIEAKEEDCKTCNKTTWQWSPVTNYMDKNEEGKCCINGKRQNHVRCPAPCEFNGVRYDSGQEIGQCGICRYGIIYTNSTKLDACHECNADWKIVEKEDKIYFDGGEKKCCEDEGSIYVEHGERKCCKEGIVNSKKTVCTPFPDKEFVCKEKSSVGKDGNKSYICCKTNDYPVDYYYSVTGSGSLGGWSVQIRDKATTSKESKYVLRQNCIFQRLDDGRCKNRSKNSTIKPNNFNTRVHPGEKACMYIYSNGGGSANYEVWFKRADKVDGLN